jgi:hypothetical protein
MGVFFCFVFFHVEENEESIYVKAPRLGRTSPVSPPTVEGLDQYKMGVEDARITQPASARNP